MVCCFFILCVHPPKCRIEVIWAENNCDLIPSAKSAPSASDKYFCMTSLLRNLLLCPGNFQTSCLNVIFLFLLMALCKRRLFIGIFRIPLSVVVLLKTVYFMSLDRFYGSCYVLGLLFLYLVISFTMWQNVNICLSYNCAFKSSWLGLKKIIKI